MTLVHFADTVGRYRWWCGRGAQIEEGLMIFGRILLAVVTAMSIGVGAAQAEQIFSPAGNWVTNGGESKYAIELCGKRGDAICAKLIWA
ncbi:MAG: hypothetical protein EOP19_01840, partial [Hyphomicrobiales bacterium]